MQSNTESRQVTGRESKRDNNVKKVYTLSQQLRIHIHMTGLVYYVKVSYGNCGTGSYDQSSHLCDV